MKEIKGWFISFFTVLSSLLGILAVPFYLLIICNLLDYITGIWAAPARGKKISSKIGFKGIVKKVCQWILIILGVVIDMLIQYATQAIGITFPFHYIMASFVSVWLICNEVISILENIGDIGCPLPPFLKNVVKNIQSQIEDKADIDKGNK